MNIIAGLITAVLAGLGVGGGGLLVIYLVFVLGTEQLQAQGINLVFYLFASAAALIVHCRKRKIDWKSVVICAVFGIVGSFLGVKIAGVIDPVWIRKTFGVFLLVSGVWGLFQCKRVDNEGEK
jgi:Predicted permeases